MSADRLLLLGTFALLGTSCSETGTGPSGAGSGETRFALPVPAPIAGVRAIVPEALVVTAMIDGLPVESTRRGPARVLSTVVLPGRRVSVEVTWYEEFEGAPLRLATWSDDLGPFEADTDVVLDPARYDIGRRDGESVDAGFDDDGDGVPNLVERRDGSDPRRADEPDVIAPDAAASDTNAPDDAPPVDLADIVVPRAEIPSFDPAATPPPVIDGVWREEEDRWGEAAALDTDGRPLFIDTLIRDGGAPSADVDGNGAADLFWRMRHDGTWLYLYVLQVLGADDLPWRDSGERFQDDDTLHLFFDGDNSRHETLRGIDRSDRPNTGDDRYFFIPLIPTAAESARGEPPAARAPRRGRAPIVPASLDHRVFPGTAAGFATGWEMRIRFDDLGIETGRPFGFEVQVDQDLDGGPREGRWSWANTPERERDPALPRGDESPALFGLVTLLP